MSSDIIVYKYDSERRASDHPLFGETLFRENISFDDLAQRFPSALGGERHIDIVNWYLQVLLEFGFIGLFLFVFPLLRTLSKLYKGVTQTNLDEQTRSMGVCVIALLVSFLLVIATTSNLSLMPVFAMLYLAIGQSIIRLKAPAI